MATIERLKSDSKRAEIIKLRFQGHTLQAVGDKLGLTLQGVKYHEDAWLAEQRPTSEQTEDRRQKQLAGIEHVRAKLFDVLEAEPNEAAWLLVVDRLDKLWAREARLMGLDLQAGVTVNVLTAEGMAAALGLDPTMVVDVEAKEVEEITDGSDA